jgi:uncharacterized membrane protein YraQ (UPF0718 family)
MSRKRELNLLALMVSGFLACFFLPIGQERFDQALFEGLHLVKWYAREHVLLCLIPAFFIAGAISVFVSHASVMKYLGAGAKKILAYSVAAVSGSVLAVCSCTVLPLFAGIYKMGAGLGPAAAFLYAGPAINVLAIVMTARVLGPEMGIARAVCAVLFSVVIGLMMHLIFRKEERERAAAQAAMPKPEVKHSLKQNGTILFMMILVLVFANWAVSGTFQFGVSCCPDPDSDEYVISITEGTVKSQDALYIQVETEDGEMKEIERELVEWEKPVEPAWYTAIFTYRYAIAGLTLLTLLILLRKWYSTAEVSQWCGSSWQFAKQIMPLLLIGVFVAGMLLGRPTREGIIPSEWIAWALGGNSISANLFASIAGAFMYFATLTEIPILEGLIGAGMGKGPALALLLAGPALSLPNMLVIRSIMGTKKTAVFVLLVIVMATISGIVFGALF